MELYLISQDINNDYDTYDSAVVCAENEEEARNMYPGGYVSTVTWCLPKDVKVDHIGSAKNGTEKGVICSSFNAG